MQQVDDRSTEPIYKQCIDDDETYNLEEEAIQKGEQLSKGIQADRDEVLNL